MCNMMILIIPVFIEFALEVNFDSLFRLGVEPYTAAGQPVIGQFGLPAVFQLLLEDTVFITDGVTHCRHRHSCHTVQITCG